MGFKMKHDIEGELSKWELYKSYGEFNINFENAISIYRIFFQRLIHLSYDVIEKEDENEEVIEPAGDRLFFILLDNLGAMEIVSKCKAAFIDFFSNQKKSFGSYTYEFNEENYCLHPKEYDFALLLFKKSEEMVVLRNVLIHSNYFVEFWPMDDTYGKTLQGYKSYKTSKGFESRKFKYDIKFFQKVNANVFNIETFLHKFYFYLISNEENDFRFEEEYNILKRMDFTIPQVK